MKTQPHTSKAPIGSEIITNWKTQIKATQKNWNKLTEEELKKLDGTRGKLTSLVENRYHLSHSEAEKQVKSFFDKK